MLDLVKNSKVFGQLVSKVSRALWWQRGKRKESLQLRLWNLNSTSNSPLAPRRLNCQISANQRKAEMSINVKKHFKTCAKGKDVITNIISTNQHFASTFLMQLFKFQRRSCKLSFLSLPCCQGVLESLLTGYVNTENAKIILTDASHFLVHFLRWMEDMTTWREIFLPLLDLACHP